VTIFYESDDVIVHHGDCLDVLREMKADSVDAICTDPPYNLSDSRKRDGDCLRRILADSPLPHLDDRDAERPERDYLSVPRSGGTPLRGVDGAIGIDGGVGVPERALHLDGATVVEPEVEARDVPPAGPSDGDLPDVADTETVELLGDYVLDPADRGDAPFCDGTCSCFTEPRAGFIAVRVTLPGTPSGDLSRDLFGGWGTGDADVRNGDDTRGETGGPSGVVALAGAVRHAVLRLDLAGRSGELLPADADETHPLFTLRRAHPVGARTGASGLTPVGEPARIGVVDGIAHWALALHLPWHALKVSRTTAGFMGRTWDGWDSPAAFQRWCAAWAVECLRVLKPGGHMLAFGGSRTWHRLACAVEDAGFEIRDSIAWLYGCHDDQTEALTARGWVNGLDLRPDDALAQWSTDGRVEMVVPTALHRYPYDGRLVRFRNADVDQAVTPNHRVYRQVGERTMTAGRRVAAWSDWQVDEAASVNRWQRMRVPAAGVHDGTGIGGEDYAALLGWVWAEGGFDLSGTGVRVYQSSANAPFVDEIAALLDRVGPHKRYDYERTHTRRNGETYGYTMTTWYLSGDIANRVRADLPGKAPTWDLLWRMTAAEKRALWDAAMKGDGSKGSRTFWQKDRASLEWAQALLACIGYRGKIADDPRGALHWTDRDTVELQARHLRDDVVDYVGEVWCATVPSGAFVVRRNGLVSVSGNSGFPKSLDVSRAIDKGAGVWRGRSGDVVSGNSSMESPNRERTPKGEAVSDAAKQWEGWGTALKPAFEPVVVGRKPLGGTVVATVLAHGTGALNIDGCRVAGSRPDTTRGASVNQTSMGLLGAQGRIVDDGKGRWPANVLLSHAEGCRPVGTREVVTGTSVNRNRPEISDNRRAPDVSYGVDGRETVEAWECVPGCPVGELDRQSGTSRDGVASGMRAGFRSDGLVGGTPDGAGGYVQPPQGYGGAGGASRFFPTFRYEPKAPTSERPRVGAVTCACTTVKPWPSPQRDTTGSVSVDDKSWSTSTSGSSITDGSSRPATTSITSTATSSTTPSGTSDLSAAPSTSAFTAGARSETESGGSPAGSAVSSSPSVATTGTSAERDGRSTDDAAPVTSPRSASVSSACDVCGLPKAGDSGVGQDVAHPT
jgi:hypothetical protein